jgi:hypothetical protein
MLNHREVLEALLAGETLVDIHDISVTLRFDEDTLITTNSLGDFSGSVDSICLFDWEVKPRTININGYEVPEPINATPRVGDTCYMAYLPDNKVKQLTFTYTVIDCRWLKQGFLHKTREAAELHLEALLSFTKHE